MNRTTTALLTLTCILLFGLVMLYGLNHVPCIQAAKKECRYEWEGGVRIKTCMEKNDE